MSCRFLRILISIIVAGFFSSTLSAQQSDSTRRKALMETALENLRILRTYHWLMKADLTVDEKKIPAQSFNIKWKSDGTILMTEKAGSTVAADNPKARMIMPIAALVVKYMGPSDQKLSSFYEAAHMESDAGGYIEISGGDFMIAEDKVTMDADNIIFMIRRLTFTTLFEEDDLMGTIEYAVDPNAFKYPSRVKVDIPARHLSLVFENSGFVDAEGR